MRLHRDAATGALSVPSPYGIIHRHPVIFLPLGASIGHARAQRSKNHKEEMMDRTKSRGAMWGLLALVVTIGLMGSALAGGSALAAKGGNSATGCRGGWKHCGGTTATLTVSPNPVPLGTNITISGSGFGANQTVLINTSHLPSPEVTADGSGNFSFVYDYQYGPGNASVQAYVLSGSNWVMVATASFTICSTNPC